MSGLLPCRLLLGPLLRLMVANCAACGSTKKTVVVRVMAGDAANDRPLYAAFGLRGGAGREADEYKRSDGDRCSHDYNSSEIMLSGSLNAHATTPFEGPEP